MHALPKIFFHIFVLAGLALSPLYGVLSKEPNFFLAHSSEPADFFMLISMLSFVFPLVIATGYPVVSIPSDAPVVFVLFDEFPLAPILNEDLNIDGRAFPNFERLAKTSHWFRNASTNYAFTGPAIRSVFTGKWQDNSRFGTYKYFPNNLFTLLGNDYKIEAHESALRLCPPSICLNHEETQETSNISVFWKDIVAVYLNLILPQPKTFNVPEITQGFKNFWGREGAVVDSNLVRKDFVIPFLAPEFEKQQIDGREDIVGQFLDKLGYAKKGEFYFLHVLYPHQPYRFLSSGKKYDINGKFDTIGLHEENPKGGTWDKEKWLIDIQQQKLFNQVGYTDYLVGKVLDRLEENNLLNPALFILAADHGVSIKEGGVRREVSGESLGDIASVPLFVKLPGQEKGAVSDLPATLMDILPTLSDALDVKVPWEMAGHSLLNFPAGNRGRIIHDSNMRIYPVPEDLKSSLLSGVKRKQELFGKFVGWDKFRLDDENSQAFMDKHVSEFQTQAMTNVQVKLDSGTLVETKPGFLPAMVQGRITGVGEKGEWTALIAVNDVFRAVSPIIKVGTQESILAFLPEIAFKEGGNDVDVYLIRRSTPNGGKIFKPALS